MSAPAAERAKSDAPAAFKQIDSQRLLKDLPPISGKQVIRPVRFFVSDSRLEWACVRMFPFEPCERFFVAVLMRMRP